MGQSLKMILCITMLTGKAFGSFKNKNDLKKWQYHGTLHLFCRDGTPLTTPIKKGASIKKTEEEFQKQRADALIKPYQMIIERD